MYRPQWETKYNSIEKTRAIVAAYSHLPATQQRLIKEQADIFNDCVVGMGPRGALELVAALGELMIRRGVIAL